MSGRIGKLASLPRMSRDQIEAWVEDAERRHAEAILAPFMGHPTADGVYVYAIRERERADDAPGNVKIGWSSRLAIRLSELQVGNPRRLAVEIAIPFETVADAERVESLIHSLLTHRCVSGEWFDVDESTLVHQIAALVIAAEAP